MEKYTFFIGGKLSQKILSVKWIYQISQSHIRSMISMSMIKYHIMSMIKYCNAIYEYDQISQWYFLSMIRNCKVLMSMIKYHNHTLWVWSEIAKLYMSMIKYQSDTLWSNLWEHDLIRTWTVCNSDWERARLGRARKQVFKSTFCSFLYISFLSFCFWFVCLCVFLFFSACLFVCVFLFLGREHMCGD